MEGASRMKFYAYVPRKGNFYAGHPKTGDAPLGTEHQLLFELKTIAGAHKRARGVFKTRPYKLFIYSDFYDEKTFRRV
jgi:hypothetical protein